MGFGTLFIGYFLLLNIFNYAYSDLIAALLLAFALYKLAGVGRDFKLGLYATIPYAALGAYELIHEFLSMFTHVLNNSVLTGIIGILRYAMLCLISFYVIEGIKKLAKELDIPRLVDKTKYAKVLIFIAYTLALILEAPSLDNLIAAKALAIIALVSLVLTFATTLYTASAIYSAYMRICMPEDLEREEKQSQKLNKFRENEKKRGEEYAKYKVEKFKQISKKKGRK